MIGEHTIQEYTFGKGEIISLHSLLTAIERGSKFRVLSYNQSSLVVDVTIRGPAIINEPDGIQRIDASSLALVEWRLDENMFLAIARRTKTWTNNAR